MGDGCKAAAVDVVYTPFLNLKKEERMDVGQVGFKDESFRKLLKGVERNREIEKRIEKSRQEKKIDLAKEREDRDAEERKQRQKEKEQLKQQEKEIERDRQAAAAEKAEQARVWDEAAAEVR